MGNAQGACVGASACCANQKTAEVETSSVEAVAAVTEPAPVVLVELEGDAAAAARSALTVTFEHKGLTKIIEFKRRELGFEYKQSGGGCCGPSAGKRKVLVTKVAANSQAAELGVIRGAAIQQVNDKEIADVNQLRDLLAEAVALMPAEVAKAPEGTAAPAADAALAEKAAETPAESEKEAPAEVPAAAETKATSDAKPAEVP
eukprot:TRINITY_DN69393_c0_g1_i1.p1 TRINITY_DN69393_c0_g1~~TRINITY_DN69393_c0_g1_i1.p1  ORF type:complete len:232 (+),score=76.44 TRINITY_DN69393_c0_g1_i1:89-697(+)